MFGQMSMTEEFILSSRGLSKTGSTVREPFWFVLRDRQFECSTFQALFVSDAVEQMLKSDNTVNRFEIDLNSEFFKDFWDLVEGKSIVLSETNWKALGTIARKVHNKELLNKCVEYGIEKEKMTLVDCIDRVKVREEFEYSIEEEIEFIASHFYALNTDKLRDLKPETIESILSHERLCLASEESLLTFIESLGDEYSFLYGYVECRFLSLERIGDFLSKAWKAGLISGFGVLFVADFVVKSSIEAKPVLDSHLKSSFRCQHSCRRRHGQTVRSMNEVTCMVGFGISFTESFTD
jgi:hypothetical protein